MCVVGELVLFFCERLIFGREDCVDQSDCPAGDFLSKHKPVDNRFLLPPETR